MNDVKIQFWDGQNWVGVDGIVNWSMSSDYFKEGRPVPSYVAPIITTDTWNGFQQDVQHLLHDSYYLEFWVKESELQKLAQMKSCDTVIITDLTNNVKHVVDMQTSDWFDFQEPEQISPTTNFKVSFIYRTNKKTVNKFDALANEVTLIGGSGTYYSKYEKITYDGELEEIRVQWGEGGEKLLQETNNTGYKVLLYLSDSQKNAFKNDWNQNTFTIDSVDIIKKLPLEIAALGEDNYQVIASCITVRETINSTLLMPTASTLTIDTSGTVYNSALENIRFKTEVTSIFAPLGAGGQGERLLFEAYTSAKKALFYFTESELNAFQNNWQSLDTDRWDFDGSESIYMKYPLEIEEMSSGLYKVIVSAAIDLGVRHTETLFGTTNPLVVTDSGTFTFYTDYPVIANIDDTQQESFSNEDGLNVTSKTISRQVSDIKLYLNTSDKNSLKLHYERGTATINAVDILEKGIVETIELDTDLWEVDIKGLTVTPEVKYPL